MSSRAVAIEDEERASTNPVVEWYSSQTEKAKKFIKIGLVVGCVGLVGIIAAAAASSGGESEGSSAAPSGALRGENQLGAAPFHECDFPKRCNLILDQDECNEATGCRYEARDDKCVVKIDCECYDIPPGGCQSDVATEDLCGLYEGCIWRDDIRVCEDRDDCDITFPPTSSTLKPTPSPTERPTVSPTSVPTEWPSISPTLWPSSSPTDSPTASPTHSPTNAPSGDFTDPPRPPSIAPTAKPTISPTSAPTIWPTLSPTPKPTKLGWTK